MKITVRKIAEEAGVSPASVSRYINGSEDVSSEIASKVESALFSLGGSPVVRRPRKQIILILLTHLRFDFYGRTLAELLEQEPQSEYTFMLLRYNPQSPETVRNFVSRMHPVGVIYFEEEIDSGILQYLQSCGLRTVMCGGVALDHQSDRVHVNDIAAAYEGTNYLLDLGHREILFLSATKPWPQPCGRKSNSPRHSPSAMSWRWASWRPCTTRGCGCLRIYRSWAMTT